MRKRAEKQKGKVKRYNKDEQFINYTVLSQYIERPSTETCPVNIINSEKHISGSTGLQQN